MFYCFDCFDPEFGHTEETKDQVQPFVVDSTKRPEERKSWEDALCFARSYSGQSGHPVMIKEDDRWVATVENGCVLMCDPVFGQPDQEVRVLENFIPGEYPVAFFSKKPNPFITK